MKFSYGDRVRITVTLYDPMVSFVVGITAGSTGKVVSFEEYCLYRHWDIGGSGFPERVKAQIQNGSLYPVRIGWVAPLESSEFSLSCEPYQLIGSNHLILMEKDEQETLSK